VGEFKKAQLKSEMQLTHFDDYTRKAQNKSALKDKEGDNEKNEAIPKKPMKTSSSIHDRHTRL
jgi:hypothetical protein